MMKKEITMKELEHFQKKYHEDPTNKLIENAITRSGIDDVCFNRETLIENQNVFNVETELGSVQNQKNSGRCWCFAGTNMIRGNIAKNMNIEVKDLALSNVYLTFYDRLEKFNNAYENLFTVENLDYDYLLQEYYLMCSEGGWYESFSNLVTKYGILPASYMPESHDSIASNRLNNILQEKLKYDANTIIELRAKNTPIEKLRKEKERMLSEVYEILCKVLGEPTKEFTLEYQDKDKKKIRIEHMTPMKFKKQYLTIDPNDFVLLKSIDHYKKNYYQKYQDERAYGATMKNFEYINVPLEELEKAAIKQLKDNIPVWFACPTNKMWNRKEWILDMRNYNYFDTLGMKKMDRKTSYNFHDIPSSHAMSFVGVHLIDRKPVRWKVENSWGNEKDTKQYLIMNQNYFEERVTAIAVHKKYLSAKVKKCLDQTPIIINIHEL